VYKYSKNLEATSKL